MLAHELSHVAHRDVLVMTVASSAGIIAGMLTPGRAVRRDLRRRAPRQQRGLPVWLVVLLVSLVTYAISFLLLKVLSRYRELSADRAGAYLTMKPHALASALQKITGDINQIPDRDLRQASAMNAFFIAPAAAGISLRTPHLDAPDAGAAPRAAREDPGRARPTCLMGFWDVVTGRSRPKPAQLDALFAVPTAAITLETTLGLRPTGDGLGLLPVRRGSGVPADPGRRRRAARRRPGCAAGRGDQRRVRLHLAAQPARPGRRGRSLHRPARGQHDPRGAGLRARAALLAGPVRRRAAAAGSAWSTSTSRRRSTRSRRSPAAAGCGTTCSRSRCATRSPASCRWSRTSSRWLAVWGAPGL